MKRIMLSAAVIFGALLVSAPEARADHGRPGWGIGFGFGTRGGFVQGRFGRSQRRHHVHHRVPMYRQVWVPARYEQVFVGYCVSPGFYRSVVSGYRCGDCGICF